MNLKKSNCQHDLGNSEIYLSDFFFLKNYSFIRNFKRYIHIETCVTATDFVYLREPVAKIVMRRGVISV